MKACTLLVLHLFLGQISDHLSSPIKDVKANRRLLAAILGYRKEDVGFINEVIGAHNKYRRIHGCRDLSQCARLRQQAGLYAQELADQGAREAVSDSKVKFGIGENIYISCGNEVTAEEAVSHWYNEACNYFRNQKSYEDYKHFAQVVWKATYLIGVGRRTSTKAGQKCTYVVTRYRPGAAPGPAESINIPKGNFDSSICSGNNGGSGTNTQENVTPQSGNKETAGESGAVQEQAGGQQPSQSGGSTGPGNAGTAQKGAHNGVSQPGSTQVVVLPAGYQPAKFSTPAGSTGTETNETGKMAGNSGITGSNSIPNVTPTSIPGTGDLERATDPENSHISPLIEQPETGSEGSLKESGGEQVSPKSSPHCPPCPGNEVQTESFETSGNAESLPESSNDPRSTGEGQQSSVNPDQSAGSNNPRNPSEQNVPGKPDKPAEQVNPVDASNPANPGKPAEQVSPVDASNPANPGKPAKQVNPVDTANPVKQGEPHDEQTNPTKPGNGQCPPCSCSNKEGNEKSGEAQGSQSSQQPEGGKSSLNQERPGQQGGNRESEGRPSGKDVSQGTESGKEVPQGQPSEGSNVPTNEIKPNSEGNVVSPVPSSQGGGEGSEGNPAVKGVNEGNTGSNGPSENQPTKENQPTETGSPNSPSEGTGMKTEGSNGATGASPGGNEGSQGVTDPGNQSQSAGNTDGTGTAQGEGSTRPGESGSSGTGGDQGGQEGATQSTGGQGGGESGNLPEGGAFIESLDDFQKSALEAHNKYRQLHNSPPLAHNREMSTQATEFAKKLAKSSIANAEHSLKSSRENQGENVYTGCATNPSGADVTKEWYKELCNYDYNKNAEIDEKKPIGHFTQVVWKSSTEFGIGRAYSADQNCVYIVARYKPAGNVIGSEASNIARSKMDGEYCGREFMALNKPENGGMKEGTSSEGQPNGASEVGSEQPNQNSNEGDQQGNGKEGSQQNTNTGSSETSTPQAGNVEGGQQNTNTGSSETSTPQAGNVEGGQQNTNTGSSETSTPEAGNVEGGQQNTNTGEVKQSETASNTSEGNRQETSTDGKNEQQQANPSGGEGERNKRIKTPFLPGYLQKSMAENKRFRGLRIE